MNYLKNGILVLALGNDLMGDDAAGLIASRKLKNEFGGGVDIFEIASAGFLLLDVMEGYDKVLLLDTIQSQTGTRGNIRELEKEDLSKKFSNSPHYVGLPELMELAGRLDIKFPGTVKALVMEINENGIIREGLNKDVNEKIPLMVTKAREILNSWLAEEVSLNSMLI